MEYISQLRQGFNEGVRYHFNRLYGGLGDTLTTKIDKKLAVRGLGALAVVGYLALATSGCTRTEAILIGGLAGAAIGGPIGHQIGVGYALEGAAIGAGAGAVGGAIATEE